MAEPKRQSGKKASPQRTKPGPKPKPPELRKGTKPNAITIRGSDAWYDWVKRLAGRNGLKPTPYICMLLAHAATEQGFEEPPERL